LQRRLRRRGGGLSLRRRHRHRYRRLHPEPPPPPRRWGGPTPPLPPAGGGVGATKPSYGRVSQRGIYPSAVSLDHPGPIARSARDAGLLLQGMAGFDAADPTTQDVPVPDLPAGIAPGARRP